MLPPPQLVTGYYRVSGLTPHDCITPQQALDYVVQETPWALASVVRSGRTGRLVRRPVDASPSRFDVYINGDNMVFTAWIDTTSLDTLNEGTIQAAFAAGTPHWRCGVLTRIGAGGEWRSTVTHAQLVSLVAVMEALQDLPQEAERYLRSVVMV